MARHNLPLRRALGLTLAELRKEQAISVHGMSKRVNTCRTSIRNVESGRREISLSLLGDFAKVLDIELSALFELVQTKLETLA
jgi:transcriptional regulator with XRE-family HTH domain